jgi:hypothetical protein
MAEKGCLRRLCRQRKFKPQDPRRCIVPVRRPPGTVTKKRPLSVLEAPFSYRGMIAVENRVTPSTHRVLEYTSSSKFYAGARDGLIKNECQFCRTLRLPFDHTECRLRSELGSWQKTAISSLLVIKARNWRARQLPLRPNEQTSVGMSAFDQFSSVIRCTPVVADKHNHQQTRSQIDQSAAIR